MGNFFSLSLWGAAAQASQTGILSHMQPQIISLKLDQLVIHWDEQISC